MKTMPHLVAKGRIERGGCVEDRIQRPGKDVAEGLEVWSLVSRCSQQLEVVPGDVQISSALDSFVLSFPLKPKPPEPESQCALFSRRDLRDQGRTDKFGIEGIDSQSQTQ